MLISRDAERLLRKYCKRTSIPKEEIDKQPESLIVALEDNDFLVGKEMDVDFSSSVPQTYYRDYEVTDAGRAYIHSRFEEKLHFRLTTAISIMALIISILSVILSPFITSFFSDLYGL